MDYHEIYVLTLLLVRVLQVLPVLVVLTTALFTAGMESRTEERGDGGLNCWPVEVDNCLLVLLLLLLPWGLLLIHITTGVPLQNTHRGQLQSPAAVESTTSFSSQRASVKKTNIFIVQYVVWSYLLFAMKLNWECCLPAAATTWWSRGRRRRSLTHPPRARSVIGPPPQQL